MPGGTFNANKKKATVTEKGGRRGVDAGGQSGEKKRKFVPRAKKEERAAGELIREENRE